MYNERKTEIPPNLGRIGHWPILLTLFPVIANKFAIESFTNLFVVVSISFLAVFFCFLLKLMQLEYRTLFKSNMAFKVGSLSIYFLTHTLYIILNVYFPNYTLTIFSYTFIAISGIILALFYSHFYQPKYFINAGWVKSAALIDAELKSQNIKLSTTAPLVMLFVIFLVVLFVIALN